MTSPTCSTQKKKDTSFSYVIHIYNTYISIIKYFYILWFFSSTTYSYLHSSGNTSFHPLHPIEVENYKKQNTLTLNLDIRPA